MRSSLRSDGKSKGLPIRKLTVLAMMGALMFASQVVMAFVPNVHLVALLIIVTGLLFGWEAFYSVILFVFLEGITYGFGLWWFSYLYVWPVLVLLVNLLRKNKSVFFWAVIAAVHGLCFGALCSIPYFFMGGANMAFSYWISGVPFDVVHCVSNFVLTLILLKPLSTVIRRFALLKAD
ncbi:MAG: hypothetical protein ACOX1Q_11145 [Eubacteriales bacterium]|jgi:energy-coupling factor transport system substrate-specific component